MAQRIKQTRPNVEEEAAGIRELIHKSALGPFTYKLIAAYFRSEVPWKVLRQPLKEEIDFEFHSCGRSMERFTCHRFSLWNWYGLHFLWSICSGNNGTDSEELVKDVFGGEHCFWLTA